MPVANLKSKWTSGNLEFTGAGEIILESGVSFDLTADKVMMDLKAGDVSTIDPSATAETGWINIKVDGTKRYIPFYAAS